MTSGRSTPAQNCHCLRFRRVHLSPPNYPNPHLAPSSLHSRIATRTGKIWTVAKFFSSLQGRLVRGPCSRYFEAPNYSHQLLHYPSAFHHQFQCRLQKHPLTFHHRLIISSNSCDYLLLLLVDYLWGESVLREACLGFLRLHRASEPAEKHYSAPNLPSLMLALFCTTNLLLNSSQMYICYVYIFIPCVSFKTLL